jgi:hypothetical protein
MIANKTLCSRIAYPANSYVPHQSSSNPSALSNLKPSSKWIS